MDIHPEDIFHSSGFSLRHIDVREVNQWRAEDLITVYYLTVDGPNAQKLHDSEIKATHGDYAALLSLPCETGRLSVVHGGSWHCKMAAYAEAFLHDLGKEVLFEQWANGHRVDVISTDQEWIIECGDTSPKPLLEHLLRTCKRFAVLPFQQSTEFPFILYVFEQGPAWDDKAIEQQVLWGDVASRTPQWEINPFTEEILLQMQREGKKLRRHRDVL